MFGLVLSLQQCTTEQAALLAIFNTNGGIGWVGAPLWATEAPYCSWNGVTCNEGGFVIGLDLSNFGLTGQLTSEIGCLPFVKAIFMNNEALTSSIPVEICNLQHLQYLQMNQAGLIGSLPTCLCTMQNLMFAYLDHNLLSGEIPTCVGNMTFLREMHLTCNTITGTIPTGFNTLAFLTELRVNCNAGLDCTSELAGRSNFIFLCGDFRCEDCTITPSQCPAFVDVPNCGRYYKVA